MSVARWRLALVVAAIFLIAVGSVGFAQANAERGGPNDPAAAQAQQGQSHPGRKGLRQFGPGMLRRVVHGEALVDLPGKGLTTVAVDRGRIAAIGNNTVSISEKNGQTVVLATNAETRVRKDRQRQQLGALKVGDEVLAFSTKENGRFVAQRIVVPAERKDRPAGNRQQPKESPRPSG